jgi:putative transposase
MARQARNANTYGIYHIFQQGYGQRPLFTSEEDRITWLQIVARAREKFHFKLYAYCVTNSQEYHLVVNLQGGDISKVMKSINIAYAMYAKCSGQLFKDRYKSTLIENKEQLLNLMAQIHRRSSAKSGTPDPYNSFCCYRGLVKNQLVPLDMSDLSILEEVVQSSTEGGKACNQCIKSMEEARTHLKEIISHNQMDAAELKKDKAYRNQLIIRFRHETTLSLKDLGLLFGGLSESAVSKIITGYYEGIN